MTTPMHLAADRILTCAPTATRVARRRNWIDSDGAVDWDRIAGELPDMCHLSGGEWRLLEFALLLSGNDLHAPDPEDGLVVAAALRAAAEAFEARAHATSLWMEHDKSQ